MELWRTIGIAARGRGWPGRPKRLSVRIFYTPPAPKWNPGFSRRSYYIRGLIDFPRAGGVYISYSQGGDYFYTAPGRTPMFVQGTFLAGGGRLMKIE